MKKARDLRRHAAAGHMRVVSGVVNVAANYVIVEVRLGHLEAWVYCNL